MPRNPELDGILMPYKDGIFEGKRMDEIPPRLMLEMYFTDHFVGMHRMWVVQEMARLKEECGWVDEDRVKIRITRKINFDDFKG